MIPDNKYCPICGKITHYNCKTIMRDHLDCKCWKNEVLWKYKKLEEQERAREMRECSHVWEYLKLGPEDIKIRCMECSRVVNINIERLLMSKYVDKEVDNSPGAMLNRASDGLHSPNNNFGPDLKYILDALIAASMMINNRIEDD